MQTTSCRNSPIKIAFHEHISSNPTCVCVCVYGFARHLRLLRPCAPGLKIQYRHCQCVGNTSCSAARYSYSRQLNLKAEGGRGVRHAKTAMPQVGIQQASRACLRSNPSYSCTNTRREPFSYQSTLSVPAIWGEFSCHTDMNCNGVARLQRIAYLKRFCLCWAGKSILPYR